MLHIISFFDFLCGFHEKERGAASGSPHTSLVLATGAFTKKKHDVKDDVKAVFIYFLQYGAVCAERKAIVAMTKVDGRRSSLPLQYHRSNC